MSQTKPEEFNVIVSVFLPISFRDKRKGSLQVDDEEPISHKSSDGANQLDTNGDLWIGQL